MKYVNIQVDLEKITLSELTQIQKKKKNTAYSCSSAVPRSRPSDMSIECGVTSESMEL